MGPRDPEISPVADQRQKMKGIPDYSLQGKACV